MLIDWILMEIPRWEEEMAQSPTKIVWMGITENEDVPYNMD